jgi:hypothetical protein
MPDRGIAATARQQGAPEALAAHRIRCSIGT